MGTPPLTTKLYVPPLGPNLAPRPRLIQRLDEGLRLGRKLTLVSAPAGFGKTTLLSEWIARSERPELKVRFAWVSLDRGDNDPICFWSYVVAALHTTPHLRQAGVRETVVATLKSPQPPPIDAIPTALLNEIATVPEPFCLVLDDYHAIKAQAIHSALAFLLDHQPPPMRLVIATRADPPLPIARLRGRGQVTELRVADLRFTPDEIAVFLNRVSGISLSADDVVALEARTEGWITGLQLAAISMQRRQDIPGFIDAFTGSHRHVLDYLTEEVLRRQPEYIQSFLLETAILEHLIGPLCNAVTGRGDSAATLAAPCYRSKDSPAHALRTRVSRSVEDGGILNRFEQCFG